MSNAQARLLVAFAKFLIKTVPSRGASTESERLKLACAAVEAELLENNAKVYPPAAAQPSLISEGYVKEPQQPEFTSGTTNPFPRADACAVAPLKSKRNGA